VSQSKKGIQTPQFWPIPTSESSLKQPKIQFQFTLAESDKVF
jgi:hypothetical protein